MTRRHPSGAGAAAIAAVLLLGGCIPAMMPELPLPGAAPAPSNTGPASSGTGDGHVTLECANCGGIDITISGGPAATDAGSLTPEPGVGAGVGTAAGLPELVDDPDDAPLAMALRSAEDLRLEPYPDTGGVPHIGYGHRITPAEAEGILAEDLAVARAAAQRVVGDAWPTLHVDVQEALIEAAYMLGATGLSDFHEMLEAVRRGDRTAAAGHMVDSLWALQAPDRVAAIAARLAGAPVAPCPPREYP